MSREQAQKDFDEYERSLHHAEHTSASTTGRV
jgi:hypothetical protein